MKVKEESEKVGLKLNILEKEMATHSSILAWRIPWTEEPGGLQSTGSQSRIRLSDFTFTFSPQLGRLSAIVFDIDCFL